MHIKHEPRNFSIRKEQTTFGIKTNLPASLWSTVNVHLLLRRGNMTEEQNDRQKHHGTLPVADARLCGTRPPNAEAAPFPHSTMSDYREEPSTWNFFSRFLEHRNRIPWFVSP